MCMEKKRIYEEARMKVVNLSGKSTLLAGSDAGGGSSPAPAFGSSLSSMGEAGELQ